MLPTAHRALAGFRRTDRMFENTQLTAYLAAEGYEEQLALELGKFDMRYERLFVV